MLGCLDAIQTDSVISRDCVPIAIIVLNMDTVSLGAASRS